jgi:hypothetical protein
VCRRFHSQRSFGQPIVASDCTVFFRGPALSAAGSPFPIFRRGKLSRVLSKQATFDFLVLAALFARLYPKETQEFGQLRLDCFNNSQGYPDDSQEFGIIKRFS